MYVLASIPLVFSDATADGTVINSTDEGYRHEPETEPPQGIDVFKRKRTRELVDALDIDKKLVPCFGLAASLIDIVGTAEMKDNNREVADMVSLVDGIKPQSYILTSAIALVVV